MVKLPEAFSLDGAETLVRACHRAWRRRQGALGERARKSGERFDDLVRREYDRVRIDFAHCKNAATFRATLTDFWSRAAAGTEERPARPIQELQTGWQAVLPYLTEERWQFGRDLALLALASYAAPATGEPDGDGEPSTSNSTDTTPA
jgi:CRISPR-associated protein Cas8a1/Csx13